MTPVTVRTAAIDDLDAAAQLFVGYLRFYARDHAEPQVRAFLADRLRLGDSSLLLAETDGPPVGLAQVYPMLSSLDLAPAHLLSDLYVTPAARGTGAGRALLREVVRRAREAGAAYVSLETAHTNLTAQGLYESEEFVRDAEYRTYVRDCAGRGAAPAP